METYTHISGNVIIEYDGDVAWKSIKRGDAVIRVEVSMDTVEAARRRSNEWTATGVKAVEEVVEVIEEVVVEKKQGYPAKKTVKAKQDSPAKPSSEQ